MNFEKYEFLQSIPRSAGRVLSVCSWEGLLIICTDLGGVYVCDPGEDTLQRIRL